MHKLMILSVFALVFFAMIGSSSAVCGGCGCNIFGCNCDYPVGPHCRGSSLGIFDKVIPSGRRKRAVTDMFAEFTKMDTNGDGQISIEEAGFF